MVVGGIDKTVSRGGGGGVDIGKRGHVVQLQGYSVFFCDLSGLESRSISSVKVVERDGGL